MQLPTGQLHVMGWSRCLQPANNRFAVCPLEPLEYRIMAGIAGLEPTGLSQRPVPWPLGYIPLLW